MKHITRISLLAIGLASLGLGAHAQHHRGHDRAGAMMDAVDGDGDGVITRAEVETMRGEKFAKADENADGAVSLDEMQAFHEAQRAARQAARLQQRFDKMDADGNGTISDAEFGARMVSRFEQADRDGDGEVSEAEREAARNARRETMRQRMRTRGKTGRGD